MDTLTSSLSLLMGSLVLESRALGATKAPQSTRSPAQNRITQILGATCSSISIAASLLSFYWFIKMRRSFRHDLVMLLIQTDMFKSLFFLIYPVYTFIHGRPSSTSSFCQVNGFFLLVGLLASDYAILLIAIHTALYIFRPKKSGGEGGLYPYRKFAYAICVLLPIVLASIAFINPAGGYASMGSFCYLPVRPFWYRLSLIWIPRYLIFAVIITIYASIYVYVGRKFAAFTALSHNSMDVSNATEGSSPTLHPQNLDPRIPPLAYHGLIPHSPQDSLHELEFPKPRRTEVHKSKSNVRRGSVHQFMILSSFTNRTEPHVPTIPSEVSIADLNSTAQQNPVHSAIEVEQRSQNTHDPKHSEPFRGRNDSWRNDIVTHTDLEPVQELSRNESRADIDNCFQPDAGVLQAQEHEPSSHGESPSTQNNNLEILQTRDKIQKQLRYMFIYPLVYMGMWIIPFASHVFQYNDNYASNTPFVLSCLTTVSICLQAGVDAWLFCSREKPWRHIPTTDGGFWESLRFWTGWEGVRRRKSVKGVGKTRDEMVKEARNAYQRRDAELAQQRTNASTDAGRGPSNGTGFHKKKSEKSWWDSEAGFGETSFSPSSEVSNPFEGRRMSRTVINYARQLSRRGTVDTGPSDENMPRRHSHYGRSEDEGPEELGTVSERKGSSTPSAPKDHGGV